MTASTYVRARIDEDTKDRASAALQAMGLSVSDAIRLLMVRIADEQQLPFAIKVPNSATQVAMSESRAILSKRHLRFKAGEDLIDDLEKAGS